MQFEDMTNKVELCQTELEVFSKKTSVLPFDTDVTLLIDADTHAYRAAAAADGSYWALVSSLSHITYKVGKYKSDVLKYKTNNGLTGSSLEQRWDPEPLHNAIHNLERSLDMFRDYKCEFWLTPKTTFRNTVVSDYKANRIGKRKPFHLKACIKYLEEKYCANRYADLEADDAVIIRATELTKGNKPWVIVGCDKDLRQIPGTFYEPFKKVVYDVTSVDARKNLWRQIATGDTVDNIITPKGLGPKTFDKFFKDVDFMNDDDWSLFLHMIKLYSKFVEQSPEASDKEYLKRLALWIKRTASLVYLRRSVDDVWTFPTNNGEIRW